MINIDKKIVAYRVLGEGETGSQDEVIIPDDIQLPDEAEAKMKVLHSEGKKWYLTVTYHPNTEQPFALFVHTNNKEKSATTNNAVELLTQLAYDKGIASKHVESTIDKCKCENNVSKLTRMVSLLLRHGVLIKNIVAKLEEVDDVFVGSFLFQIRKFLSQYIKDGEEVEGDNCSECGGTLVFSEGCMICRDCGFSKCG